MRQARVVPAADDVPSPIRAGKKKGPKSRRRIVDTGRGSREQERRVNMKVREEEEEPWAQPSSLKAPEPRPGMVQRWIRVGILGAADPVNLARKTREGWKPREASSVPKGYPVPKISQGAFAGFIGVEGMVLMEMPKERNARRNKFFRDRTNAVTEAIDNDLLTANRQAGGGFKPIRREAKSIPVREKRVPVQDDVEAKEEAQEE